MFGLNKITPPEYTSPKLNVHSIWDTIQGEGPLAGHRATFVRMAGCNLKCYFCDTDFSGGTPWVHSTLVKKLRLARAELVVITGGEPMAQPITNLICALLDMGKVVQIETAGTCAPPDIISMGMKPNFHVVVSPKTSKVHKDILNMRNLYFKYIIRDVDPRSVYDGLPAGSTQIEGKYKKLARAPRGIPIYVQPCDESGFDQLDEGLTANRDNMDRCIMLVQKFGYIMSLQTHKILEIA